MSVTSVAKREATLNESPAAIHVITQEDIRRSGLTSLPELLRTTPGLEVARINANRWAISSRGFNAQFANKLLVLVDGRAVYGPAFSGIYWNAQDVAIEDLDRIEVIRGPGAALWGANAVNGVINIITKSAKATQGGLVTTSVGTEDQPSTTIRYGGQLATNLFYRAYAKYFSRDGLVDAAGQAAPDDWNSIRGGLRLDWEPSSDNRLTLQADYYDSEGGGNVMLPNLTAPPYFESLNLVNQRDGANVLGRWTHSFSDASQLTLQTYYDHVKQEGGAETALSDIYDVEAQHHLSLGTRHEIVYGAGYRLSSLQISSSFFATLTPPNRQLDLVNVFAQDEITLHPDRLKLTLGSKFEHNDLTGLEIQPSARLLWTPVQRHAVWAAVSRAVRTPSLLERDARINFVVVRPNPANPPTLVSQFGNPNAESEELIAYELGYRVAPTRRLSVDVALFYNVYDGLIQPVAEPPRVEAIPAPPHGLRPSTVQNLEAAEAYGAEWTAQWQVTDIWRLAGSYTWLHMRLHLDRTLETDSPQQQFQLHSYLDLPNDFELNGSVYFVDQISPRANTVRVPVPSYFRFDLGLIWRPKNSWEIGLWGQNLLDAQHPEFYDRRTTLRTEVPRSVYGKITWRF